MQSYTLPNIAFYLSVLSAVVALGIAISRRSLHPYLYSVFILLIISVFCGLLNIYFDDLIKNPQRIVGKFYRYSELVLLFFFYQSQILRKKINSVIFSILFIISIVILSFITDNDFSIRTINSVIFILTSIVLYAKIMFDMRYNRVDKSPIFWVNTGFFISFSGSFFLFLLRPFLIEHYYLEYPYIWSINNWLSILKNVMICYAFLLPGLVIDKKIYGAHHERV